MLYTVTKLNTAVGNADEKMVRECLEHGVDPNEREKIGNRESSPLDWLTHNEKKHVANLAIVDLLLEYGADPLASPGALASALRRKDNEIAAKFLRKIKENCERYGGQFCNLVIEEGDEKIPLLFCLIKKGNKKALLLYIDLLNDPERRYLSLRYRGMSPLFYALLCRQTEAAFNFLDLGSSPYDVDSENTSVLQYLVRYEDKATVSQFLQKYRPQINHSNDHGESCIHDIAFYGAHDLLDLFSEQKTDLNQQNFYGGTPLHLALEKLIELQEGLGFDLDSDSDCEILDSEMRKAYKDQIKTIKKLLSRGVTVRVRGHQSQTAIDVAGCLHAAKYLHGTLLNHEKIETLAKEFHDRYNKIEPGDPIRAELAEVANNLIKIAYQRNAGVDLDLQNILHRISQVMEKIDEKPFIDFNWVRICEIITALINRDYEFKIKIKDRFDNKYLKNPVRDEDYYYTVHRGILYRLTKTKDGPKVAYQLMTTLVYEAARHPWTHETCQLHHALLCKFDPKYSRYTLEDYRKELHGIPEIKSEAKVERVIGIEEKEGTYFGENLSDDSDIEEEKAYQAMSHRRKSMTEAYTQILFSRSQPDKLVLKKASKKSGKKQGDLINQDLPQYDKAAREHIHRSTPPSDQVQRDLEKLNMLAITGALDEESIKTIATSFCVAQYRGVGYRIIEGNKLTRKLHRLSREENQPQFSRAVLQAGGYPSYFQYLAEKHESKAQMENKENEVDKKLLPIAEALQDQLLQLAASGPVKIKFIGEEYNYDHALHALQDFYTKAYDKFHDFLGAFMKLITPSSEQISITDLKNAIAHSIGNPCNPVVSTAETPGHALRYAYNDKYYESYKDVRLRPRWRSDGLCEQRYSGKVYISLHKPLELCSRSHHVVSLNTQGEIHIDHQTIAERETSFFGFIPPDRVISQHTAKFPSFCGAYKHIYFEKYGLTEELYKKFQKEIQSSKPHTKERKHVTRLVTAHLVSYQEVCLIEEAQSAARKVDAVLVYRNEHGGFSLHPCQPTVSNNVSDKKRKLAAKAHTEQLNKKRKTRKDGSVSSIKNVEENKKFLTTLLKNYSLVPAKMGEDSLLSSLASLLAKPVEELQTLKSEMKISRPVTNFFTRNKPDSINQYFNQCQNFLSAVAKKYQCVIQLHCPELEKNPSTIKDGGESKDSKESAKPEIHLYYAGGQKFAALQLKPILPVLPSLSLGGTLADLPKKRPAAALADNNSPESGSGKETKASEGTLAPVPSAEGSPLKKQRLFYTMRP